MAAFSAAKHPVLKIDGQHLVSANLVHKADITPMMAERAMADILVSPHREIALRVRRSMMATLPDDVIGAITESHIAFGAACALEAIAKDTP